MRYTTIFLFFFFNDTATTEIYTLSLHDALPICPPRHPAGAADRRRAAGAQGHPGDRPPGEGPPRSREPRPLDRSEEHTSELQSPCNLVCRLLLEKKKKHIHVR